MRKIYDKWDMSLNLDYKHSYCIPIQPLGIGTPFCESLTSYIARLAQTHCISPATFYTYVLDPAIRLIESNNLFSFSPSHLEVVKGDRLSMIGSASYFWNGKGESTYKIIKALEMLTGREDLRHLTLYTWRNVLSKNSLSRKTTAWCPICFEEWENTGTPIYIPLLWLLKENNVCAIHKNTLEYKCTNCQQPLKVLYYTYLPGFCYLCKHWLGQKRLSSYDKTCSQPTSYELWKAENLGQLISLSSSLSQPPTRSILNNVIREIIFNLGNGCIASIAKEIGVDQNLVRLWIRKTIPSINFILFMCYKFNIPFAKLFSNIPLTENEWNVAKKLPLPEPFLITLQQKEGQPAREQRILQALEQAMTEIPPPSIKNIGDRLGYKSPYKFKKKFPQEIKFISSRRSLWASKGNKTLIQKFNKSKESNGNIENEHKNIGNKKDILTLTKLKLDLQELMKIEPPLSFKAVTKSISYKSANSIAHNFPEEHMLIVSKYKKYREQKLIDIQRQLENILIEDPPIQLKEAATRLNYNKVLLYKNFPTLTNQIANRYKTFKHQLTIQRRETYKEQIRATALDLIAYGIYPSVDLVTRNISNPILVSWPIILGVLQDLRNEMNISIKRIKRG